MTALQVSIGSLNDIVDAPRDSGRVPAKPIPGGLVSPAEARAVAVGGAAVGLVLAAASGTATVALAVVVLAIGYAYDLVFKGTAWSWLPFALGIPLLPVYGWLGAAGGMPASFAILLPVAVIAGAALAIANARADVERDEAAGVDSVATRLGTGRAWLVHAGLLGIVVVLAILTLVAQDAAPLATIGALGAAVLIATGVAVSRNADSAGRERAWEIEAIGVGLLAAAWLAGTTLGQ